MKTLAIFVIYNPGIDLLATSLSVVREIVDKIWITDNSKEKHDISGDKILYSHQQENRGIAYGQNLGIMYAIENGYDWIFFFDQDSKYDGIFLQKLLTSFYSLLKYDEKTYGIGPLSINMDSKTELNKKSMRSPVMVESKEFIAVRELMCSASVVRTEMFKKVGLMDESLFIDGVDFEISWRAAYQIGAHFYLTTDCILEHQLGEGDRKLLGRNCHIPTPFRAYYQVRNGIILSRRKYVPLKWKIQENVKSFVKLLLFPILLKSHGRYFTAILKGYRDGLLNKKYDVK